MGYMSGFEWIWFLLGIGSAAFSFMGIFIVVMLLKFYRLLKDTFEQEKNEKPEREHLEIT